MIVVTIPALSQMTPCDSAYVGKSVYGIKLVDTEGKITTLEQYKGKYLYIDFWFSACKPCIKEFPSSKELNDRLNRNDIVFITINSDTDESVWKKTLAKRDIEGDHFYDNKTLNNDVLYRYFLVRIFPHYWIVDPNGKILTPNADKPSEFLENNTFLKIIDNGR
jgi:thiol-disulfide isomerase/thioredoxin